MTNPFLIGRVEALEQAASSGLSTSTIRSEST